MIRIDISEVAVRILFLFLPGIIATYIIDALTSHRKRQPFNFIVHSYLLGVLSYGLVILIVNIINFTVEKIEDIPTLKVGFLDALLNNEEQINASEVFIASLVGILLALILSGVITKKLFYKFANWMGLSDKHGDGDIWDYLLGSNDVQWVILRDKENKVVYQGAVKGYSQKDEKREIVLSQVKVYRDIENELQSLYDMSFVYLNFDVNSNVVIEIDEREDDNNE